ncbi:MAG: F0F1 ATP synthase subunit A [Betaproteobacteria bacterium]|nr:F0F1 ATP synthase subunit A [Betaproteobacteria bacterium]
MAAGPTNPTEYIQGHLTHLAKPIGDGGGFWTLHVDSVVMAVLIGVASFGFLWWVTRRVTTGVPSKRQAFVELALDFVNGQARGIYHGHSTLVGPLALTVFVFVLMMNAMDFLPVDVTAKFTHLFADHWRVVPTADVNTTFALALSVFFLMIAFAIRAKGLGGYVHELLTSPFGKFPLLWPINLGMNIVELVAKPLSHSLRLYGNIYAGEVIFLLLGMWAATGVAGALFGGVLHLGWAIFHLLIVPLQAFIFMMLTVVYMSMAEEHH